MASSRYWSGAKPIRPSLANATGRTSLAGEIMDVRRDLEGAFSAVQSEFDLFASSEGVVVPVATLVGLAALSTVPLLDGTVVFVKEAGVEDTYTLRKASVEAPDGITVVAATGGGNWVATSHGRWDDVQGPTEQGTGVAVLTKDVWQDTKFQFYFMRHDQDDELSFTYQLPHSWDYNLPVHPHLHVIPASNPGAPQNVRVDGYYAWTRPNYAAQPLPLLASWTTFSVDIPIAPGDYGVQKIISLGSWTPPVWARESSTLLIYFRRNGTGPADTYTTNKGWGTVQANLVLLTTDTHFRKRHIGTITEIPT